MRDRGQRDRRAVGGLDVVVEQLLGIEAIALLHLRDHLVGTAVQAEIVDVAAPQQRGEGAADIAHLQAELRRLAALDLDGRLRQVDLEVAVQEDEHAALEGRLQELLRHVVEARERLGRADHELHGQAEAAGQRRRLEGDDLGAGDLSKLLLQHRLQLVGGARALVPRLEDNAGDRLAGHVELEDMIHLRIGGEGLIDLPGVELPLLERGVRGRGRQRDHDALILLRRQFGLRPGIEEIDAGQHDQREHGRHRQIVEAAV